jgi:myosin heavy subunit
MEIVKLRRHNNSYQEKASEFNMSDVKYANTLARVHQIRLDLKQTHEKYQQMTNDMKNKLNEKLDKCNEIRATFMELKREVSKKAAYSKTDKQIPEKLIQTWEETENEKSQEVSAA